MTEPEKSEQPPRARKSPTSEGAGSRALEKSLARPRVWVLVLLVCVVACASPATTARDTPVAGEEPPPRFATGGPDAEEFGASMGYPTGNPATFWRTRSRVGSFSHLDEIFRGRLIHKAPTPSRLVRVAEPRINRTFRDADLTLDDYLARNPTTGLLIARGDTILVERYQYARTDRHRFTSWFMLWGAHGQRIYVDPQSKLVMVNTAVHKLGFDRPPLLEMGALWSALVRQFGG